MTVSFLDSRKKKKEREKEKEKERSEITTIN